MGNYNVGVKSAKVGDFNPTTGVITNLVEIEVYKDTLKITEEKPTKNKHFQAGKSSPRKISVQGGAETAAFSIMNTAAKSLQACLDGTIVTLNGRDKWVKAKGIVKEQIKALVVETLDGAIYTITRGSWSGVKNFDLSEGAIALMDIEVEATDTGLEAIPDVSWEDPED